MIETLDEIKNKAVSVIREVTNALDGDRGKDGFGGGIGGKLANFFNNVTLFLQHNAAQLQDMQLNISRQLGSTRTAAYETMQRAVDITTGERLDELYGFSAQDYQKGLFNIQSNLGRQVGMGKAEAGVFAAGDAIFGDNGKTMGEISAAFLQVGSNMESVGETVSKMFTNAHKSGLSFQKISASVKSHLKEVNQYGFKNGIDGMRQMAEYAEQIGMDMNQALKASGKMNSLIGATDVAARLSVLGGNFQKLGNPLQMLNESLTDVESLQKRIGNMFSGMAKWDAQKGMISVSAVDRMRINEAASAMGLDSNEVFKSVETQARRDMIEKQAGIGLTPEMKNLIANIGTINKEGRAGIIDREGEFRDISEIAGDTGLQEQIRDLSKTEGENISDIAQNVRSLLEKASAFYERQVNLKTQFEVGGRDDKGKGAKTLRETESFWGEETGNPNSLVNDVTRVGLNVQKHATDGMNAVRDFAQKKLEDAYSSIRDSVSSLTKVFEDYFGVEKGSEKQYEEDFKNVEGNHGIKWEPSKNKNGEYTREIGDILPNVKVEPSNISKTEVSNYNDLTKYSQSQINPTNNFTITISPESKYELSRDDISKIQKVINDVVTDIFKKKEATANMTIGAY